MQVTGALLQKRHLRKNKRSARKILANTAGAIKLKLVENPYYAAVQHGETSNEGYQLV